MASDAIASVNAIQIPPVPTGKPPVPPKGKEAPLSIFSK